MRGLFFLGAIFLTLLGHAEVPPPTLAPPGIASLIKPQIYDKVLRDRLIQTHASLDEVEGDSGKPQLQRYSLYAVMSADASLKKTESVLTDYQLYAKLIPYIDRAQYDSTTHVLALQGGIWKFVVISWIEFEQVSDRWVRFRVVRGHFAGMQGDIIFEAHEGGPKGLETLVYLRAQLEGRVWPPKWIIEKGAEIVFGFTAQHMRSYLENDRK